jgi:hypothetical protein
MDIAGLLQRAVPLPVDPGMLARMHAHNVESSVNSPERFEKVLQVAEFAALPFDRAVQAYISRCHSQEQGVGDGDTDTPQATHANQLMQKIVTHADTNTQTVIQLNIEASSMPADSTSMPATTLDMRLDFTEHALDAVGRMGDELRRYGTHQIISAVADDNGRRRLLSDFRQYDDSDNPSIADGKPVTLSELAHIKNFLHDPQLPIFKA